MIFPEGVFPYIVEEYEKHNKSCDSLQYLWLGHSGGVTCFSDVFSCQTCAVSYYNEGMYVEETSDGDYFYCECCYSLTVLSEKPVIQ